MNTFEKILVIALFVFFPINLVAQPYKGEKADVNIDGNINVLDIIVIANHMLGIDTLNGQELWRADCNSHKGSCRGDGSVGILDARKIVNIIIGFDECPELLTDIDGNVYETVKIGNQFWMAENLKVTHYSNGETIPNVTDNTEWVNLTTGAYCNYNNDEMKVAIYGRLYNWFTVSDGRSIAPEGWHVPSDIEWKMLIDYLGGSSVAGGKMKERGTSHWFSPNTGATNESGFSALPGGYRNDRSGFFSSLSRNATFWSSTETNNPDGWSRRLSYSISRVDRHFYNKHSGFSVRCVRD